MVQTVHVILSPRAATELSFDLVVRSKLAHTYTLKCVAVAVQPVVSLSHSIVSQRVCCVVLCCVVLCYVVCVYV